MITHERVIGSFLNCMGYRKPLCVLCRQPMAISTRHKIVSRLFKDRLGRGLLEFVGKIRGEASPAAAPEPDRRQTPSIPQPKLL